MDILDKDAHFFLDKYVKGGKAQRQQPYVKYKPVRRGQTTTTGTPSPTLCDKCLGSLTNALCYPCNTEN